MLPPPSPKAISLSMLSGSSESDPFKIAQAVRNLIDGFDRFVLDKIMLQTGTLSLAQHCRPIDLAFSNWNTPVIGSAAGQIAGHAFLQVFDMHQLESVPIFPQQFHGI